MANLAIIPAQVIPSVNARPQRATAGVAINAGDLVYKDATGLLQLSDADGATAAQNVGGMAVCSGGAGQLINYITDDDEVTLGENVASGEPCFLSATAGKMSAASDRAPNM